MAKYFELKYLFLFFALIWLPFQYFILKVDAASRSLTFLTLITFLYYFQFTRFRRIITAKPSLWWGLWVGYTFLDTMILGYNSEIVSPFTFFFIIFRPLLVLWVINYHFSTDRKKTIDVVIAALYLHALIVAAFASFTEMGRFGVELNENYIALSSYILLFFLILKNGYHELSVRMTFLLSLLPIVQIILSGSRTAFGAMCILFAGLLYAKRSKSTFLNLAAIGIMAITTYSGYTYVMENTYLGERLKMTTNQLEHENIAYSTGTILDKLGDRGLFYFVGYKVFKENPIFGVGLGNFKDYNDFELVQHSEYMIQLSELGVVGAILFLLFYLGILRWLIRVWRRYPEQRRLTELYLAGYLAILFVNAWTRSCYYPMFFCYFGMAIAYIRHIEAEREK